MSPKRLWENYKNGNVAGILRGVITILLPLVGFLCWNLASDVRQRFTELGAGQVFIMQNIVPRGEFNEFKEEMHAQCERMNDHISKDEYRWEIFDITKQVKEV